MSSKEDNLDAAIGRAVKQRRQELGWSVRSLAARSAVSASMISAIERAAKSPTVSTLGLLARAMALPPSSLLDAGQRTITRIHVKRLRSTSRRSAARDRVALNAAIPGSHVGFLRLTVPPRALAGPFAGHARGTIEHVHLAKGRLRVVCGEEEVVLDAGDSCSCYTDVPHSFDNRESKSEAMLYVVVEAVPRTRT